MNNQIDLNALIGYMVMIMMIGMMMKVMTRALKPAAERPLIYGPRGEVLTRRSSSSHSSGSNPKPPGRITVWCPICEKDIEIKEYNRVTRPEALRKHIEEEHKISEHSIHGPERQKLVDRFGTWAVGRAESICPEDDVACVEREAGKLIYAYRRSFTA